MARRIPKQSHGIRSLSHKATLVNGRDLETPSYIPRCNILVCAIVQRGVVGVKSYPALNSVSVVPVSEELPTSSPTFPSCRISKTMYICGV